MNERQAEEAGYHFTGAYSHDKEEMKAQAKQEREKGYLAIVVNCPPNPLSRGHHGMGYSVYHKETPELTVRLKAEKEAKELEERTVLENAKTSLSLMTSSDLYKFCLGIITDHSYNDEKYREQLFVSKIKEFLTRNPKN